MYRLNIVSTNPTGSVQQQQQQQQQQGSIQTVQSGTGQPTQLTLVQQPVHQQQSTAGGAIQIIGLTSLNALTNATTITGLAAAASSGGSGPGSSGTSSNSSTTTAVVTAQKILKAAANNNNISIVKIGDEIMLKAVKVEPLPVTDTGGGGGGGGGGKGKTISATTSGGVTVTAIPVQASAATVAVAAPASSGATGTVNGNVIYGGKRRLESNNEEWISSPSPGSVPGSAPPLSPSPGSQSHTYTTTMSNGYSSPMSTGSYDPYSPNGKMGKSNLSRTTTHRTWAREESLFDEKCSGTYSLGWVSQPAPFRGF